MLFEGGKEVIRPTRLQLCTQNTQSAKPLLGCRMLEMPLTTNFNYICRSSAAHGKDI